MRIAIVERIAGMETRLMSLWDLKTGLQISPFDILTRAGA